MTTARPTSLTRPARRTVVHRAGRQRGFTLIELMVAMVVSAIVVLGIFAFSSIQQSTSSLHERSVRTQQALEGAMWSIGQDVREAGAGFARLCTELRVYDPGLGRLINPGAIDDPTQVVKDPVTGQAYWVLRDAVQAHWNSSVANDLQGAEGTSASPTSAADALDVIVAESNYLGAAGVFTLAVAVDGTSTHLVVETSAVLDNTVHLEQVRQLFPPGSFVVVARPMVGDRPFDAHRQGQCALLQVTGDVVPGGSPQLWQIPIANTSSFNQDLDLLMNDAGCTACPDWAPGTTDNVAGTSTVIPLGRLRWSRYEVDYTIPRLPYLVRYDIIGWQNGDLANLGGVDYPDCNAGECRAPQLHLFGSAVPPAAVAIGPMIEDMQVAVGCDGYTVLGAEVDPGTSDDDLPVPDLGYEEVGPAEGPYANQPNFTVDENSVESGLRTRDEWLGNAANEQWAPDCVYYGTGEAHAAEWVVVEGSDTPPPAFRMSPQTLRVTLIGSSEAFEAAVGLATDRVAAVEDRPAMVSPTGFKERFSLSERFTPENLRWRNPRAR